jgi:hypothetical protein
VDLYALKPGDKVRTIDDNLAVVVSATEDGEWIKIRYLASEDNPKLIDTEDLCSEDELVESVR